MTHELWDGRYRMERTLGEGGMGQVVMARDIAHGERYVAVKLLSPDHRDYTTDFMREYSVQRCLNHPAIPLVHAFGFGERRGREVPYFVMDYIRGIPLATALGNLTDPAEAWMWIVQVLRGLDHTHRAGYLHRDLKPGNIIVTPRASDEDSAAALIDFGIAIAFDEPPEELFIGTPEYSAPDLMAGAPFDVRQDLYAIGLLLYEVLTGRRPWAGDDPTDLYQKRMYSPYPVISSPHCPAQLSRLIADLLDPKIDRRPRSAAEVIERLSDALALRVNVETSHAFYRRLVAQPFEMQKDVRLAGDAWLGRARPFKPVLVLDNPPGWDGPALAHALCDEAAVGGARIIRYALERRRHRPLEAIRPALLVLKALREIRTGEPSPYAQPGSDTLNDMAGAATLMSRIDVTTVLAIDYLEWADAQSLELIMAVLTGARNPGLRVIATCDPSVPSHARVALDRLLNHEITETVKRSPLSLEIVTDWVDLALGVEAIPDAGILSLHERAAGRPDRIRVLLAEEMRRGAIVRSAKGFEWRGGPPAPADGMLPANQSREALISLAAEIDLLLPESVVAIYLDVSQGELLDLVHANILSMDMPGHFAGHEDVRAWLLNGQQGGAREARERLARSIELAIPFPGQAERAAREWLRAMRPLRAAPCLLAAAQDALASGLRDRGDGGVRAAQLLENAGRVLGRCRQEQLGQAESEAVDSLERELGRASIRLARARGRHEDWQKAADRLLDQAAIAGHHPTIEIALEARLQLAMDRSQRDVVTGLLGHLKSMQISGSASLEAWGHAWLDARDGRTDNALRRLAAIPREALEARRQMLLALLESDIALDGGRLEQAERALSRAYAGAERSRDERALQEVMLGRVRLMHLQQRPARARELALDLERQLGDRRAYRIDGRLGLERARIEMSLGRPDGAIEVATKAAEDARRDSDGDTAALAELVRAEAHVSKGEIDKGALLLKASMGPGLLSLPRVVRRETELRVIIASLRHAGDSRRDAAIAERDRSIRTARDLAEAAEAEGFREVALRALILAAEGAVMGGDPAQARQYLKSLEERVERWGEIGLPWHAVWWLQAEAARLLGDEDTARRRLQLAKTAVKRLAVLMARNEDRQTWLDAPWQGRVIARAGASQAAG